MDFKLLINDFEGPLDLLLHLVKTSKMDIYEIDLKIVIDKYLEFINSLKNQNIDIASSYLIMASELIHLKSKMLINSQEEDTTDEYSINSEEDLRTKLIEYEKYQRLSALLEDSQEKRSHYYTKSPMNISEFIDEDYHLGVSLEDLVNALKNFKAKEKYLKPLSTKITKKEISIEERIKDIRHILNTRHKVEFLDLFENTNKEYLIVTFLSILTMSKSLEITLTQENNFQPIIIEKVK